LIPTYQRSVAIDEPEGANIDLREEQGLAIEELLNSKGLHNDESREHSLRGESLTSRRKGY
jgi:hypothetical protein